MAGLLEVGRVTKPHGTRGEVVVELVTDRVERVAAGSVLSAPSGPLTVERSTPHHGRWIVQFAGVHSRDEAEALRGAALLAEPLDDPDALWVHELIGSDVVDAAGRRRGAVVSVVANPASDLLELDTGELVPVRFVTAHGGGVVRVDAPAGLFEE
ncbi:MAG TPA: ribosome maturation factor RimM [Acidimicrobiales bacterium]|nr:ribosome maturation factor RimM [Acidimicrobiales bacterium]